MPTIKKLKVSFDLDVEVLIKALAEGNSGFHIEAYQPAVEPKRLAASPALLEDHSNMTLRELILERLRYTGKPTRLADLREVAESNGFTSKQLGNLMYVLYTQRLVTRPSSAVYKISKRGM